MVTEQSIGENVAALLRSDDDIAAQLSRLLSKPNNDAPVVLHLVFDQVTSLSSVLGRIQTGFGNKSTTSASFPAEVAVYLQNVLRHCQTTLAHLQTAVRRFTAYEEGGLFARMWKVWRSSFAERGLEKILRSLEAHRAALNFTLLLIDR
ncbi:hypothetical protein B0A49_01622 [Cryomyces minteri]|uniref:Uncharacterized protein n=1 Tax=Cryomyces minteri TaxID=331657 RepID=A0A4U0XYE9_9PEZI|nr:hypothetical protein B0A49_01622 [Cryomyces minteri]